MENKQKMAFLSLMIIIIMVFSGLNLFGSPPYVYDKAELFSVSELEVLDKKAADISEKLKVDIVILTISDNQDKTVADYAGDFYDQNGLGYGADKRGILLLFDLDGGQIHVSSFNINQTNPIKEMFKSMYDKMVTNYRRNDSFNEVTTIFLDMLESYSNEIMQAGNNTVSQNNADNSKAIGIYLFVAVTIGGTIVRLMIPKMDHTYANEGNISIKVNIYLENNALNIVDRQDRHINTRLATKR